MKDNKIRDLSIRIGAGIIALVLGIELIVNNYSIGMSAEGMLCYTIMVVIAATNPSDDDDDDITPHKGLDLLHEL